MSDYRPFTRDLSVVSTILDEFDVFLRKQLRYDIITNSKYIEYAEQRIGEAAKLKPFPNDGTLAAARREEECRGVEKIILNVLAIHKLKLRFREASFQTAYKRVIEMLSQTVYNRVIEVLSQMSLIRDLYDMGDASLPRRVGNLAREVLKEAIDALQELNKQFKRIYSDPHTNDLTEYGKQIVDLVSSLSAMRKAEGKFYEKAWGEHFRRAKFAQCALYEVIHILELIKETDEAAENMEEKPQENQSGPMDMSKDIPNCST
jgi:hypothetical protein